MRLRCSKVMLAAAVGMIFCALGVGAYWLIQRPTLNEASLRQTEGIEATVNGMRAAERGMAVACTVRNITKKGAYSIVLTVALVGGDGRAVAENPMVNVLNVQPGESRHVIAMVPFHSGTEGVNRARATVSLVRWADQTVRDKLSP